MDWGDQKVKQANYKNLELLFFRHDKEEMIKYDKIQNKLNEMDKNNNEDKKYRNIVIGFIISFEFMHKLGYISL